MTDTAGAVVLTALDQVPDSIIDTWLSILPSTAHDRVGAFRSRRRYRQFVAGRWLLTTLLRERLGVDLLIGEEPSGKPCVLNRDIHCSIAHSGSAVMAGFSLLAPIGVDIERPRPRDFERLVTNYFHPEEQKVFATLHPESWGQWFYRAWTRKEACAKASGEGLTLKTLASRAPEPSEKLTIGTASLQGYTAAVAHCFPLVVIPEWVDFTDSDSRTH